MPLELWKHGTASRWRAARRGASVNSTDFFGSERLLIYSSARSTSIFPYATLLCTLCRRPSHESVHILSEPTNMTFMWRTARGGTNVRSIPIFIPTLNSYLRRKLHILPCSVAGGRWHAHVVGSCWKSWRTARRWKVRVGAQFLYKILISIHVSKRS